MSPWRCEIHVHTKFCLAKKRFKLKGTWCLLHAPSDAHEEFSNVLGASRFTHQQFSISLLIMAVYVLRWRQMCHMLRGPGVLRNKDTSLITVIQVAGIAAIRLFSRHSRTMVTRFYILGHNDVMGWHLNFTSKILRIWDWVLLRRCSELFPRESWTEVISKDRNKLQPIYWKRWRPDNNCRSFRGSWSIKQCASCTHFLRLICRRAKRGNEMSSVDVYSNDQLLVCVPSSYGGADWIAHEQVEHSWIEKKSRKMTKGVESRWASSIIGN